MLKKTTCTIAILFTCALGFRLTPYLWPIKKQDIQRQRFHSVKFYDRHGSQLQEVLSKNSTRSVHVSIAEVSPYFLDAIISTEDKNYYEHDGVDYPAVFRAFFQNLASQKIVSGASTITLQLARLLHPKERTFLNKIREAYIGYRLETGMDKPAILEEYINRLPMGGNLYGIESAARAYFGVRSSDLTLTQATFLASIPNSPTRLNPYYNLREIKNRQRLVLESMVEQDVIPRVRVETVLKEDVMLKPQSSSFKAPHFVFGLMEALPDSAQTVKTTIDVDMQKLVQEQIKKALARLKHYHVTNAAAILLDNASGEVLAYAGSADYFNTENDGQYDGVRALRQPGSALKPFLYLMAMEDGFNPATLLTDIPTHYRMPTGIYSPKNYSESFHGPVRLREALANSLNVPAVRTLAKVGVERFLHRLRDYEFESLKQDAEFYGVGLVLGGGEVTLYELTRAYLCLARMGNFLPVKEIIAITDQTLESNEEKKTISAPHMNYLVANILRDAYARTSEFGFNSILNLPFPCSVKTGTSFRFCDNWTVGFTSDYTLGVWVGNFDHSAMQKVSGVSGAGPIFTNIMYALYHNRAWPEKPALPDNIIKVSICPVSGKRNSGACPTRIEELIPQRDFHSYESEICDIHQIGGKVVQTVYPAKYRPWAEQLGFKTREHDESEKDQFRMLNPKNGVVYYRLPNLAPEYQSIQFELACANKDQQINWFLNKKMIRSTKGEHRFLWQIEPGNFVITAVSDLNDELWCRAEFSVK